MPGRIGRRGARIAIVVVAVLVLLVALAPRLVPAGKVRDLIVARARAATGADVAFGTASVRLFPRLSVAVADGRISGTGEALRTATGQPSPLISYQASVDRVEVSLALGPLLRRRVEIGRVRLVRPQVEIVTAPPAPASGDAVASSGSPGAAPLALAVAALEVRDGSLKWREAQTDRAVLIEGWEQTLTVGDLTALAARLRALAAPGGGAAAGGGAARLGLTARVGSLTLERFGPVSPLRLNDLTLEAEAALPPAGDALQLKVTRAAWGRVELAAEATIAAGADGGRRLTGSWRLREAELPPLLAQLLPLAPPVAGPAGDWLASGPVTSGRLTASGGFTLPWPLPQPAAPELLVRGLSAAGTLRDARMKLPAGGVEVALAADFALQDAGLILSGLQVADAGGVLRLGGEASLPLPPLGGRVGADLRGALDLTAAAPLFALVPVPRPAPGQPAAAGSWQDFRYVGKVEFTAQADLPDAPPLNQAAAWRARLQGAAPTGVKVAGKVAGFTVEGPRLSPALAVRSLGFASDLRTLTISIEGAEHPVLAGGGEVRMTRLLPAPHAEVDLRLTRFDADKLTEMMTGAGAGSTAAAAVAGADPWSPLLGWAVGVALAAAPAASAVLPPGEALPLQLSASYRAVSDAMTLGKLAYTQVALDGTLADRVFAVPRASARLGGGSIDGSGRVDYAADPWGRLEFAAKVAGVSAGALLTPYTKGAAAIWEGKVGGDIGGSCGLRDQRAVLASLSLDGLAVSNDGVIHGSQYLQEIDRYLGVRKDLKEIRFRDFTHHLKVQDGRYTISDLALRGYDTDWWGDGWIGFDGGIDLRLTVKLPAGFRPEIGDFAPLLDTLRGDDGRLALTMQLTGRAIRPAVALDLSGAKAKTQAKVQEDVKRGVDRLLDKLKRK